MFLEVGDTSLLVDPWLRGSCYWRSWWHYPPPSDTEARWLRPHFLYLSHHHFDHFHYPSLRRLDRTTHVLVPRYAVDRMRTELAHLGFRTVTELRHGRPMELANGLCVRSYQYGIDDSALVIRSGDAVIVDLNDCKVSRGAFRQIIDDAGPVNFIKFKNYSGAQAYRGHTAADPDDLNLVHRRHHIVDFYDAALHLQPQFAVPFASMTCFLHPDSFHQNRDVILPGEVKNYFAREPPTTTELVVMTSGDSWSQEMALSFAPMIRTRVSTKTSDRSPQTCARKLMRRSWRKRRTNSGLKAWCSTSTNLPEPFRSSFAACSSVP